MQLRLLWLYIDYRSPFLFSTHMVTMHTALIGSLLKNCRGWYNILWMNTHTNKKLGAPQREHLVFIMKKGRVTWDGVTLVTIRRCKANLALHY